MTPFFNSSDTVFETQRSGIVFSVVEILFYCILNYVNDNEDLWIYSFPGDLNIIELGVPLWEELL